LLSSYEIDIFGVDGVESVPFEVYGAKAMLGLVISNMDFTSAFELPTPNTVYARLGRKSVIGLVFYMRSDIQSIRRWGHGCNAAAFAFNEASFKLRSDQRKTPGFRVIATYACAHFYRSRVENRGGTDFGDG
jgi:hypothetical protein